MRQRRTVITVEQLEPPKVRVTDLTTTPKARVSVTNGIDLCIPFGELREWLGELGLELGRAEADINDGYADVRQVTA